MNTVLPYLPPSFLYSRLWTQVFIPVWLFWSLYRLQGHLVLAYLLMCEQKCASLCIRQTLGKTTGKVMSTPRYGRINRQELL